MPTKIETSRPGSDSRDRSNAESEHSRPGEPTGKAIEGPAQLDQPKPVEGLKSPTNPSLTGTARGRRSTLPSGVRGNG